MNKINLIFHAHLPYVRHLEYPKFLEENWLFESLNESYIPLLRVLNELKDEGVKYKLSICFTPTLLTMLTDVPLQERFVNYMNLRIELGEKEVERTKREDTECHYMAEHYLAECKRNLELYESLERNILTAFKELSDEGYIELVASAATHAYLPIYKEYPNAIEAQVAMGMRTHERIFGEKAKGFWLPECGYYPGLDEVIKRNGASWCQLASQSVITSKDKSVYGGYRPIELPSTLNAFVRDWNITNLIWSSTSGYPCDSDYREFYRDIGYYLPLEYVRPYIHEPDVRVFTGYKYYAISGKRDEKYFYDMDKALSKVSLHVENFMYHIRRNSLMLNTMGIKDPTYNLCFDAELFGHRWYEGIDFLKKFFRSASRSEDFELTTPSSVLKENGKVEKLRPNETSWGFGGGADTWLDGSNAWIYRHVFKAIERMEELTHRFPEQGSLKGRFLNQASREVLLAMASDWPCIMHDNTSVSYAKKRIENHIGSFNVVYSSMCKNTVNTEWLIKSENRNAIFPDIDYNLFDSEKLDLDKNNG